MFLVILAAAVRRDDGCRPGAAARSRAPADALFDDTFLHEIRLTMNSRDWESLKANFQLNDYYPTHITWNGLTVQNVGIRSRGLGSRSGTKPGLRVDFNLYVPNQTHARPAIGRPAQQHPGPEQPPRAHRHESVLDDGGPGVAHGPRQALRQPAVRRAVPDRRISRQAVPHAPLQRERRLPLQVRVGDRLLLRGQGNQSCVLLAEAVPAGNARKRPAAEAGRGHGVRRSTPRRTPTSRAWRPRTWI